MSATNTGWRLMLLDAPQVNLSLETSPILMELVSPGPQGASAGGGNVNVVSGDGITVTESPADTFTVRVNFGSAGNTVCEGNDARLSDARTPLSHTHPIGDVSGLQTALDGKASVSHAHAIADVTGLQTALDGKASSSHTHTASQISDSSAVGRSVLTAADAASARSAMSAAASSHAHVVVDVTGLQTALDGKAAASHTHPIGDISGLGSMASLGSTAGGDLSGTWPTITVQRVQGNTFAAGTPTDGDIWTYVAGSTRWSHFSFIDILSANDIGWDGTTFTVTKVSTDEITLTRGESITNSVNGRIEFNPSPPGNTAWRLYADLTSFNVGVRLGVINTDTGIANPTGSYIVFDTTAQIATDKSLSIHSSDWMQLRGTSTGLDTAQLSVLVNNAGSSGAFALVDLSSIGVANRSPTTAHIDPTFYVYSADNAQANDFVRMSHDRTDGVIEAGNGKLRLKGASVVRIEGPSGGFDLPATAGSSGQVLTTNGTNASWQTPSGGGVSKAFAIAMAVAL